MVNWKIILIGSATMLLIATIIISIIFTKKKKAEDSGNNQNNTLCINCTSSPDPSPPPPSIISINHKKNELIVYNDNILRITSIKFYNDTILNLTTNFYITYLLNVYDIKDDLYYAHISLINLKKEKKNQNISIGGKDIRENNNIISDFPLITFEFDNQSKIYNLNYPESLNKTLYTYLVESIEKIIPKFNDEINSKNNNISFKSKIYYKEENNISLENEKNETYDENSMSFSILYININENGIIDKVKGLSKNYIKTNTKNQIDFTGNSNFSDFILDETNSVVKPFIQDFNQIYESKMNLESYVIDENITKEITEKIKKITFNSKNETVEKKSSPFYNKLLSKNQLRLLDIYKIDPYYQPIYFPASIFRKNELENLMGIFSKFTFTPLNSLFGLNIYLNVSNNEIPVFNDEQYTNFNEIIDLIDDVLSEMQQLIKEEIEVKSHKSYDDIRIELENQLNSMILIVNDFPEIGDLFMDPLNNLFL